MAATTQMLNFGGTIKATNIATNNGSCLIPKSGKASDYWNLKSERTDGSTVIVFSMVLSNRSDTNAKVDVCLLDGITEESTSVLVPTYVAKDVIVVPGRPVSLDYKINMTSTNSLYVCADVADVVDIVISAVQMQI